MGQSAKVRESMRVSQLVESLPSSIMSTSTAPGKSNAIIKGSTKIRILEYEDLGCYTSTCFDSALVEQRHVMKFITVAHSTTPVHRLWLNYTSTSHAAKNIQIHISDTLIDLTNSVEDAYMEVSDRENASKAEAKLIL